MADAKLFARSKVTELKDELRQSLGSRDKGYVRLKSSLKKVIANMTMGVDGEPEPQLYPMSSDTEP